jgi:hypothetical protein
MHLSDAVVGILLGDFEEGVGSAQTKKAGFYVLHIEAS